jgi:toxin ParE1/3/4
LNIKYARGAEADLDTIREYIVLDNPVAADSVIQRILQAIAVLENFPLLGRDGRVEGTREFSVAKLLYFVVYRIVDEAELRVLTIMHAARQNPPPEKT